MNQFLTQVRAALPEDAAQASLAGRVWRPDLAGPFSGRDPGWCASWIFPPRSRRCATCARRPTRPRALRAAGGETIGSVDALLANTPAETRDPRQPWLLAPLDLQAIKAAGVTFAISMLERVIEERARGDMNAAGGDPSGGDPPGRRRPEQAEARVARGDAAEGGADRAGGLEPVPWRSASGRTRRFSPRRSRWPRSGPGWTRGIHPNSSVEQPGAGGGAGGLLGRADRRRDAGQRRQSA